MRASRCARFLVTDMRPDGLKQAHPLPFDKRAHNTIFRTIMTISFKELIDNPHLLHAISDAGYTAPTPVQTAAIPAALTGSDLCVCAQTGSGKTAAFLLPSLARIAAQRSNQSGKGARILVLTPTRELAQQVEENAKLYGQHFKWLRTVSLVGGTSYGFQTRMLAKPIDLIIATPGRLMDHMQQGRIDFSRLETLVLDEADRMLDMGFIDDIKKITAAMPATRQTLLFSATLDGAVGKLAQGITRDAQRIDIERSESHGKIDEFVYYCDDIRHKHRILDYLLRDTAIDQAVIFTATKAMSEELADALYEKGYAAHCLHGDMPQSWRNRTLRDLHSGRIKILVATDVAARGIDAERISHVFNFDLPKQPEDYVHRIGRTGRAGRHGIAITFSEVRDYVKVHKIESYIKRKLTEAEVEGMAPTRKKTVKKAPGKKPFGKSFNQKPFAKQGFGKGKAPAKSGERRKTSGKKAPRKPA